MAGGRNLQGLSTRETAVVLDLPDLVVRQVLARARVQLRDALEG